MGGVARFAGMSKGHMPFEVVARRRTLGTRVGRQIPSLPRAFPRRFGDEASGPGDRRALTSDRGSTLHLTPMLIQHLQLDPDVPDAEHVIEPQVRMIVQTM